MLILLFVLHLIEVTALRTRHQSKRVFASPSDINPHPVQKLLLSTDLTLQFRSNETPHTDNDHSPVQHLTLPEYNQVKTSPQPSSTAMANPAPATILDHKLSFLSAQILALSAPLRVPSSFAQNQHQAAARRTDADTPQLRQAAIDAAMLKLNARLRQHSKQVYGHVAKRHVAEQVEGLYLRGADGEEDGDGDVEMGEGGDGEMKGLQVGMDFSKWFLDSACCPGFFCSS